MSEMNVSDNLSEQKKATVWYFVANIIQKASMFLIIPLYTRVLSLEEYGIYTVTDSWMEILLVVSSLNLYQNTFNVAIKKYDDKSGVTSAFCGLSILVTGFFCIMLSISRNLFIHILNLNIPILFAYSIYLFSSPVISIWYTMKRYFYEYKGLMICAMGKSVVFILLGFSIVFIEENQVIYAIYVKSVTEFIIATIVFIDIVKKNHKLFDREYWKFGVKMAVPLIPYYISLRILQHLDRIMIGDMRGDVEAAKYGITYRISNVMMMVNTSLHGAYTPWLYANIEKEKTKARKTYLVLVMGVLLLNVCVSLLAPEIVAVLGTKEYKDAIYVLPPILLSAVFIFIYDQFVNIELYYEKNGINALLAIIASLINALLNWMFIPKIGYIAAGYTTLLSYLCFMIMHKIYIIYLKKTISSEDLFSNIFLCGIVVLCLGLSIIVPALYSNTIVRYICIIVLLIVILVFSKRVLKNELRI